MQIKRNDILLLGAVLLLALLCFAGYYFFPREKGVSVTIKEDGKLIKTLPLEQDIVYTIQTKNKKHTNVLKIKDGSASIIKADCPDKLCVHQKRISKAGETLVCLPHKIIVSIADPEESSEETLDGIVK